MINLQNKVDKFITSGNIEFAENRNVICALVDYQRALDVYDYMDKYYKIQHHELLVRIAICYDILGNYSRTMDYLSQAMKLVPNICNLVLYKSVLFFANGDHSKGLRLLNKFKSLSIGLGKENLFDLFRLVFSYVESGNKKKLLDELTVMLNDKNKRFALAYYLKAIIYLELDKEKREANSANSLNNNNSEMTLDYKNSEEYRLYEKNLKLAEDTDPADTDFLIKDGISAENLTKIFFMILPEMDDYQPKPLANYFTFNIGISIIFTLYRSISCFKLCAIRNKLNKDLATKGKDHLISFKSSFNNSTQGYSSSIIESGKAEYMKNTFFNFKKQNLSGSINYSEKANKTDLEKWVLSSLSLSIFTWYFAYSQNIYQIFINYKSLNQIKDKPIPISTEGQDPLAQNEKNKQINYNQDESLFTNFFIKNMYYSPYNIRNIYLKYISQKVNKESEKGKLAALGANSLSNNHNDINQEINSDISRVSHNNTNAEESLILSFFKDKDQLGLTYNQKQYLQKPSTIASSVKVSTNNYTSQKQQATKEEQYKFNNYGNNPNMFGGISSKMIQTSSDLNYKFENPIRSSSKGLKISQNPRQSTLERDEPQQLKKSWHDKEEILIRNSSIANKLAKTTSDYLYSEPGPVINLKKKFALKESKGIKGSENTKFSKNLTHNEEINNFNSTNRAYYKPQDIQTIKFSAQTAKHHNKLSNKISMNSVYLDSKSEANTLQPKEQAEIKKQAILMNSNSPVNYESNKLSLFNQVGTIFNDSSKRVHTENIPQQKFNFSTGLTPSNNSNIKIAGSQGILITKNRNSKNSYTRTNEPLIIQTNKSKSKPINFK